VKELSNYITDCNHIYADAPPDYSNFNRRLAVTMLLQAHRVNSRIANPPHQESSLPPDQLSEQTLVNAILKHQSSDYNNCKMTRANFSIAFDSLAEAPSSSIGGSQTYTLTASSFDREFSVLITELAPYVRSIAAYDLRLEAERLKDSSLISAGGRAATKKLRMTRAARSAAVGGKRENTRRERWFEKDVNLIKIMETGGSEWAGLGRRGRTSSTVDSVDEEGSMRDESANGSARAEQS